MKTVQWRKLIFSIFLCQSAGVIGSFFTVSEIPTWYQMLVKPSFYPPRWVFGPVWITLYTFMGISLYRVLMKGSDTQKVRKALYWFGAQLVLNSVWPIIFFGRHDLGAALVAIILLWGLIYLTIRKYYALDRIAAYLLLPYLAWVFFAMYLNYSLWLLNR
ncbi:tryptophan-rich sensory protein [Candidatus Gottesmanbacteria bacterium]|nr:tryptophan-rich sensory protein [Candidatus Gottesmanbacteria bacterium]